MNTRIQELEDQIFELERTITDLEKQLAAYKADHESRKRRTSAATLVRRERAAAKKSEEHVHKWGNWEVKFGIDSHPYEERQCKSCKRKERE